tara:strand:+ start:336 stop:938 length:603 start_codon:yes stop_codon:yes gene_type:complete
LLIGVACLAPSAISNPTSELADLLGDNNSFSASFQQVVRDKDGSALENVKGKISIQDNKIRWEIEEPYVQTIIVRDGLMTIYDPDLEQLVVRKLNEGFLANPIGLLLGNGRQIERYFTVESDKSGKSSFLLEPLEGIKQIPSLILRFDAGRIDMVIIRDRLNQSTRIDFSSHVKIFEDSDLTFELEVPPGTDIIGSGLLQ